jgi:hypothetical protein
MVRAPLREAASVPRQPGEMGGEGRTCIVCEFTSIRFERRAQRVVLIYYR